MTRLYHDCNGPLQQVPEFNWHHKGCQSCLGNNAKPAPVSKGVPTTHTAAAVAAQASAVQGDSLSVSLPLSISHSRLFLTLSLSLTLILTMSQHQRSQQQSFSQCVCLHSVSCNFHAAEGSQSSLDQPTGSLTTINAEWCSAMLLEHHVLAGRSWGSLPIAAQTLWRERLCDTVSQPVEALVSELDEQSTGAVPQAQSDSHAARHVRVEWVVPIG